MVPSYLYFEERVIDGASISLPIFSLFFCSLPGVVWNIYILTALHILAYCLESPVAVCMLFSLNGRIVR